MQQKRIFKNGMSQATEFQLSIAEWPAISSPIPKNQGDSRESGGTGF